MVGGNLESAMRKDPEQYWLVPVETGDVEESVLPAAAMVDPV